MSQPNFGQQPQDPRNQRSQSPYEVEPSVPQPIPPGGEPYQGGSPYPRQTTLLDQILASLPAWFPRDPLALALIGGGGLIVTICACAACLGILLLSQPVAPPSAPTSQFAAGTTFATTDPLMFAMTLTSFAPVPLAPTLTPTVLPGSGDSGGLPPGTRALNPYLEANLGGMQGITIEVLNSGTGQYEPSVQYAAGSAGLNAFARAFNIGGIVQAGDTTCPTALKMTITKADNSQIVIGACLAGQVILRGQIPGLDNDDLAMGEVAYFTDVIRDLVPNLPIEFRQSLGIG